MLTVFGRKILFSIKMIERHGSGYTRPAIVSLIKSESYGWCSIHHSFGINHSTVISYLPTTTHFLCCIEIKSFEMFYCVLDFS